MLMFMKRSRNLLLINLIESLANNLLHELFKTYPMLDGIRLRIRKYSVPIAGIFDNVEIEVAGGK